MTDRPALHRFARTWLGALRLERIGELAGGNDLHITGWTTVKPDDLPTKSFLIIDPLEFQRMQDRIARADRRAAAQRKARGEKKAVAP